MKPVQNRCGLVLLVSVILAWAIGGHIAFGDEPTNQNKSTDAILLQEFLNSMSLTPRRKSTSSGKKPLVFPPSPPATASTRDKTSAGSLPVTPSCCDKCGGPFENGKCNLGECSGQGGVGASQPDSSGKNLSSASKDGGSGDSFGGMSDKSLNQGSAGSRVPAKNALNGNVVPQGSSDGSIPKGNRVADGSASSASLTDDMPPSSLPSTASRTRGGGTPSSAVQPLDWEIVRPAGVGAAAWASSLNLEGSQENGSHTGSASRSLDSGTIRSSLQTGPDNPLLLPPEIASVVFVIDSSSSMEGKKFIRVSNAVADAISQMSPQQRFAILLFNMAAMQVRGGGYREGGSATAKAVRAELAAIDPNGGTNPTDALFLAIQLKPETIVVLSDGDFSMDIVRHVTELNRNSGLNAQINCVAIGQHIETLQVLAALNGPGNYAEAQ